MFHEGKTKKKNINRKSFTKNYEFCVFFKVYLWKWQTFFLW